MSTALIVLTVLCLALGALVLIGGMVLWRTLRWETVDDDQPDGEFLPRSGSGRSRLKAWLKPKPKLLTYGRDRLGRFRRYRR